MILESFPVGAFQCNCVVIGDEESRDAVVIDPGDEIDVIREVLDQHRLNLRATLHTHGHLDHIGAAGHLKQERGCRIHIHEGDLPLWRHYPAQAAMFGARAEVLPEPDSFLHGGDRIDIAPGLSLDVVETPGHTPGSVCFRLADASPGAPVGVLFSGDTLFWKGIGRTDLWGGDYPTILASIRERIFTMPEDVLVHPGHGPVTSIHDEKRSNPFLRDILSAR